MAVLIRDHLVAKCGKSPDFEKQVENEKRTMDRCLKYVFIMAADMNKDRQMMLAVDSATVFGWAEKYWGLDDASESAAIERSEKLRKQIQNRVSGAQKAEAAPAGKEKQENKKSEPAGKAGGAAKTQRNAAEKQPKEEAKPKEKPARKEPKAAKPKADGTEGQMSIFDLM